MVVGLHIGDRSFHNPIGAVYEQLISLSALAYPSAAIVLVRQEPVSGQIPAVTEHFYKKRKILGQRIWLNNTLPGIIKKYGITHYFTYEPQELALEGVKTFLVAEALSGKVNKDNLILSDSIIAPGFSPLPAPEKQEIRDQYTGGTEYFICTDHDLDTNGFTVLLKAFSRFKKWQQSSWKLVICSCTAAGSESREQLLGTYHYRKDVVYIQNADTATRAALTAAAYALVHVTQAALAVLEAMATATPVIAAAPGEGQQLFMTAENNPESLGAAMQELYKDETLRNKMGAPLPKLIADRNDGVITTIQQALHS